MDSHCFQLGYGQLKICVNYGISGTCAGNTHCNMGNFKNSLNDFETTFGYEI